MSSVKLSATTSVLQRVRVTSKVVTFSREDEDLPAYARVVSFDRETYEDLGSPELITITIEPGDKLNGQS